MAFWGVEVKPGKPFTHEYDGSKGRLHISMATLGFGGATARSTLQCNVGDRSPVYLCSLYPGTTESLQLNLELEEVDKVIFTVIGPRSIHLCGYYLGRGTSRNANINDDSESYGEDIADTETERSDYSDEDEYEGSFIDDDAHPEVFPPSPISNEEKASHDNRMKGRKRSLRRLRRNYQLVESDDDGDFEEKIIVNDKMHDQTAEVDNEDSLPISSIYKNKASERILDQEMNDRGDRGADDASNKNGEDGGNSIIETDLTTGNVLVDSQTHRREAALAGHLVDLCTVLDGEDIKTLKKKKKRKGKEIKRSVNGHSMKLENTLQDDRKMDKMTLDVRAGNEQKPEHDDDNGETETMDEILPSSEVGYGQGGKPKKKRKERSKEGIVLTANGAYDSNIVNLPQRNEHNKQPTVNGDVEIAENVALPAAGKDSEESRTKRRKKKQVNKGSHVEGDIGYHEDIAEDYKANRDKADSNNLIHNFSEGKEQHQKLTNENSVDNGARDFPDGNQNEGKVKKRKKKSKNQGNIEVNSQLPLSVEQSSEMEKDDVNKNTNARHSQVRTLSSGLVIQELEMGKKDGKIAASGKKISVHYTGKLKEDGEVFESNSGQGPFKFRLGKGEVIEGWDVGLEGMRVGEKRRLVIPPSMTSKNEEYSETVPPNSWLVYDFELVKVH